MSVLVKQGVTEPDEAYRVGQVIRCVVISLTFPNEYKGKRPRKALPRILLSLDLGESVDEFTTAATDGSGTGELLAVSASSSSSTGGSPHSSNEISP